MKKYLLRSHRQPRREMLQLNLYVDTVGKFFKRADLYGLNRFNELGEIVMARADASGNIERGEVDIQWNTQRLR
ncbi:hypothetical protein, partial [Pseudobutyrivibrio sp. NOR37]|uniref:hypothetical protein n=1 Tax=Pseudobutyrivibrio sp. NOR37 TaxID=1798168 RepID=UPI001A9A31D8